MSNLKATRERVGLTQAGLADVVGVTQGAIAHYENGRRNPGLNECRAILAALNARGAETTLDELFPQSPSSGTEPAAAPTTSAAPDVDAAPSRDRRRPEAQSSTRRRGRRVGDLSEAEFTERLARAREGAYPEEFTPPAIPKPSVE